MISTSLLHPACFCNSSPFEIHNLHTDTLHPASFSDQSQPTFVVKRSNNHIVPLQKIGFNTYIPMYIIGTPIGPNYISPTRPALRISGNIPTFYFPN